MTISEKLKSMNDNQLAAFLLQNFGCNKIIDSACRFCDRKNECTDEDCLMTDEDIILKWLQSERSNYG